MSGAAYKKQNDTQFARILYKAPGVISLFGKKHEGIYSYTRSFQGLAGGVYVVFIHMIL